MTEGSTFVDGIDSDADVDLEDQDTGGEDQDTGEDQDQDDQDQDQETDKDTKDNDSKDGEEDNSSDDEDDSSGKTDKGTKLDKDPLSQANQLRANAEAQAKKYEDILTNPEKFKQYAKIAGFDKEPETKKDEIAEALDFKPENLKTVEDVTEAFSKVATVIKGLRDENQKLIEGMTGMGKQSRSTAIASSIQSDIQQVRSKFPELNPNNKDAFNPELEREIGEMFDELDFDPQTKEYRGSVSLLKIAEKIMKAAGYGKKTGADKANTNIIEKGKGKVRTGKGGNVKTSDDKLTPGQIIANRIKNINK